jgi:2-methylisocitrate lyase-like PEP mutase family enzyme
MKHSISTEQTFKANNFRALHENPGTFVMPCAWDRSSAIIFEESGFKCIGTTSGGVNWAQGRQDYVYSASRKEMLDQYAAIASSTNLPVSADLENGYGDSARDVADTIDQSIALGMVGGSIEDQKTDASGQLLDIDLAVERIIAARQTADLAGLTYTLTARCEIYSSGVEDPYSIAVDRLNRYFTAGADCLFVPGLSDPENLKRLIKDVEGPISFGMGATKQPLSVNLIADLGIRRISTGGGLARAAFSTIRNAAAEILVSGEFNYLDNAISDPDINAYLKKHGPVSG